MKQKQAAGLYGSASRVTAVREPSGERGEHESLKDTIDLLKCVFLPTGIGRLLRCDVMVALGILVPSVSVRIATPQQKNLINNFDLTIFIVIFVL